MVEARGLHKSFDGVEVLRGVDLALPTDSITGLVGAPGSGKSVLIRQLIGLQKPDRGEALIFGRKLWSLSTAARNQMRNRVGVLFQEVGLLGSLTLFDNIAFPLRQHTAKSESSIWDVVVRSLADVGLSRFPDWYPCEVPLEVCKRAGIARALVAEPDVAFFDEPDLGLDRRAARETVDLIVDLHNSRGGTYFLTTCDARMACGASDHVGLMCNGRVVRHDETSEAPALDALSYGYSRREHARATSEWIR